MGNFSAKNKIYVLIAGWVVVIALLFLYGFPILDISNEALVNKHAEQQRTLATLQAEVESFKQAQSELDKVLKQKYSPEDLFSQDVSLVQELRTLEELGQRYNINMTIGGLSGTLRSAQKAKTLSEVFMIPYSLSVTGSYENTIAFLEHIEHLRFITTVNSVSMGAISENEVSMNLSAVFYLRK